MSRLEERIRIGIVGLGWVGQEVARAALEDGRVSLVGVADIDQMKSGRDLGEIIGEGRLGVPIDTDVETMLRRARPEVAVVSTTSDVEVLGPTLERCIAHGAHVVTTCENLADGELALAQLDAGFDERARDAGVVVLATGVNPGFAMDRLPVMLAQATRNIRRIRVLRVVDASTRRAQLQAKIGVGRHPSEFADAIRDGSIGHAGLSASLRLVSKGLGVVLEKTSEAFSPVIAAQDTTSTLGPVLAGRVRGIYQIARGYRAGREVITLELTMALGEPRPRDVIDIVGEPPIHFEGELPGDECTVATVLSAIAVVVNMQPGLRTVLDVPLEQPEEPPSTGRAPVRAAVTEVTAPSRRLGSRPPSRATSPRSSGAEPRAGLSQGSLPRARSAPLSPMRAPLSAERWSVPSAGPPASSGREDSSGRLAGTRAPLGVEGAARSSFVRAPQTPRGASRSSPRLPPRERALGAEGAGPASEGLSEPDRARGRPVRWSARRRAFRLGAKSRAQRRKAELRRARGVSSDHLPYARGDGEEEARTDSGSGSTSSGQAALPATEPSPDA